MNRLLQLVSSSAIVLLLFGGVTRSHDNDTDP